VINGKRKQTGGWVLEWVPFEDLPGEAWKDVTVEVLKLARVDVRIAAAINSNTV